MSVEIAADLEWIKTKLSANATLVSLATGGFHLGAAPVGTVAPWVTFGFQSGHDVLTFNVVRLQSSLLFLVNAVGPTPMFATLAQMAALIDDEMKRTEPEDVTGAHIATCFREEPFMLNETRPDGTQWTHLGGLYRSSVEQA